jgi:hypothetical protein
MLSLEQVERVCGAPAWVWRELESGGLSVVLKSGQKHKYTAEEVKAGLVQAPGRQGWNNRWPLQHQVLSPTW